MLELNGIDKTKKYIKLLIAYPNHYQLFKKISHRTQDRAILIGTPVHGNLGDSLIAQQCLKYLKKTYREVLEIPEFFYEIYRDKISIYPEDHIYVCGGGWMGNLYEDELVIEDIISRWPQNKKIVFPQTIYFSQNGRYSSVNQLKKVLLNDEHTIICVREENSYQICINCLKLPEDKCLLLPDMALLALENVIKCEKDFNKIIFSIRHDDEKSSNDIELEKIRHYFSDNKYSCFESSTVINKKIVKLSTRDKYIKEKIDEYSKASLIITDRLHSMVFSLLAGTKCIAIDNSTHKVSGVYKAWMGGMQGVWVVDNSSQISIEFVERCLSEKAAPISTSFYCLLEELQEKVRLL